ncbi:MAG: OmpA/MotB domain protein [uncultured Aureispira sp.]|uniref:OmpA/MotB domain protein n=1 Tax=uncultured Aureispira sp. TaxID=1331704 RepID=A0A6S6RZA7_9BACT|nr:MAG: OmpA/MotB domain protein [uncultured Aureispira sp.]
MKFFTHLLVSILFTLGVNCPIEATPDYTDYLPKYRSQNKNFMLTKIEYKSSEMVIHFRYIASREEENIYFPGSSRSTAWKLYTSSRGASDLIKYARLENIKINGVLKAEKIEAGEEPSFVPRYGEIIRGEAHFSKLPGNIRAINFKASTLGIFSDILVKEDDSPMLGTEEQMKGNENRFDRALGNSGITVVAEGSSSEFATEKDKAIIKAKKPIKYTPKQLNSAKDFDCNTRVILKNVYFGDNSATYDGRINAMKTIQVIVDYMNYHPESIIILHGHSDVLGDQIRNFELSKERVLAVRNSLVLRSIDNDRIRVIAHGSKQPLSNLKKGGKKNRRVEAELVCEE